jgi:hypothetical protein
MAMIKSKRKRLEKRIERVVYVPRQKAVFVKPAICKIHVEVQGMFRVLSKGVLTWNQH